MVGDIVAVRKMNHGDGTTHDDDDADCAYAEERAEQYGEAAAELGEADEIADGVGGVHEGGEVVGARAAEGSEEDGSAVVNEGERAGHAMRSSRFSSRAPELKVSLRDMWTSLAFGIGNVYQEIGGKSKSILGGWLQPRR